MFYLGLFALSTDCIQSPMTSFLVGEAAILLEQTPLVTAVMAGRFGATLEAADAVHAVRRIPYLDVWFCRA